MKKLVLTLISFYKKFLSPANLGVQACRFIPTCSDYTYQAVEKYGVVKGFKIGAWRILRCNPFSKGGYDPVQ